MTPKSNRLQQLPESQNCPHCSSFRRLALICPSLNLTDICVPGPDLPLPITRVPTRKIHPVLQSGTIFEAITHPVCSCRCKKQERTLFCNQVPASCQTPGQEKAIIAIARMMLTSIYHMLSDNEDFHPDDYEATVNPPKQKPVILTLDNTLQFLREQGADPETLKLIQQQCAAQDG